MSLDARKPVSPPRVKRMALTLPPDLVAALDDLSDATGRPGATIAVELLSEMTLQMHDIAKIARQAKAGQHAAAKRTLQHMLGTALADVLVQQQPDLFTKTRNKGPKKRGSGD